MVFKAFFKFVLNEFIFPLFLKSFGIAVHNNGRYWPLFLKDICLISLVSNIFPSSSQVGCNRLGASMSILFVYKRTREAASKLFRT